MKMKKNDTEYHTIIPSFFELLSSLHAQNREFTVLFRTFGADLPHVSQECPINCSTNQIITLYNEFCMGKHPEYQHIRMDGVAGKNRMVLKFHGHF